MVWLITDPVDKVVGDAPAALDAAARRGIRGCRHDFVHLALLGSSKGQVMFVGDCKSTRISFSVSRQSYAAAVVVSGASRCADVPAFAASVRR